MRLFVDTGNLKIIESLQELGILSGGITINPKILQKIGLPYSKSFNLYKDILNLLNKNQEFMIQVLNDGVNEIIEEAKKIKELDNDRVYVKIPLTRNGLIARQYLLKTRIKVTMTMAVSAAHMLFADYIHADCVAAWVNRVRLMGRNPIKEINNGVQALKEKGSSIKVLGASLSSIEDFGILASLGIYGGTLSEKSIFEIINDKILLENEALFKEDSDIVLSRTD